MSRLEEILQKHEDQKEFHFHEIDKLTIIYPAVREYVEECVKASLEKASEKAKMNYHDGHFKTNTPKDYVQIGSDNVQINKESITNPENIVLL